MKIILLHDVKSLGKEGDSLKVKDGYARNYLIPRKLAIQHTAGANKIIEAKQKRVKIIAEKEKQEKELLGKKISKLSINIRMESGVNDTLFGTITPDMISNVLKQEDIIVDKKCVVIKEPIKKLGVYTVEMKLHPEVKIDTRIWVVKK